MSASPMFTSETPKNLMKDMTTHQMINNVYITNKLNELHERLHGDIFMSYSTDSKSTHVLAGGYVTETVKLPINNSESTDMTPYNYSESYSSTSEVQSSSSKSSSTSVSEIKSDK